ncbi:hypothetical protein FNCP11_04890 [Fusobacterium nucleatum]|jgi:ATP synthase F0, B subunit|nr:hypothetical protein FNCP11_04890 [Fusobacterium nucleatum]BEP09565.1 hypothetical protein FNSP11_04090 [Fusobacterium nucleatum]
MILLLPDDLINSKNYDEVYKLIDSSCLGINFQTIDDNGNKIKIKELKKREALKKLEELGETKVLEKYKAGKYIQI